ncbi:unnamed protein product [Prunus armeniaca]
MVAFGTQPTDSSIRSTSFSRTRGRLTIYVYSSTSKIYTTSTPPKTCKRITIPQNGGNQNLRHTAYWSVSLIFPTPYLLKHRRAFSRYHTGAQCLTERVLFYRSRAPLRPKGIPKANITKLSGKVIELFFRVNRRQPLNGEHSTLHMGYLLNLKSLHWRNNHLSGELPSSLQSCTKLLVVDLGGNKFDGSLPLWIGSLSDLLVLNFRSNKLQSSIPSEFCNLINLQILDLADNNLSGTIPRCFHKFSAMATLSKSNSPNILLYDIYSYGRYIVEAILVTKGREVEYREILGLVTSMDLSNNIISGDIPEELTSLLRPRTLNLSENLLTGRIPSNIGNMTRVESLDFSMNQHDGEIPQSMTSLTFLSHLNLSHNNLTGRNSKP